MSRMGIPMGRPNGSSQCYGRTDGRTKTPPSAEIEAEPVMREGTQNRSGGEGIDETDAQIMARLLADRAARHSPHEGSSIAWVIEKWLERTMRDVGRRWPVIRSGERDTIPWLVRASIYARDGQTCKSCGWYAADGQFELDHCIPWSAGGPDDTDNLRTLCSPCNQQRSNYIDQAHLTNLLPTTYWCFDCWTHENRTPRRVWKDGTNISTAPLVGDNERAVRMVFCAHCRYISQSDVYFVGERGRQLIAQAIREVVPA